MQATPAACPAFHVQPMLAGWPRYRPRHQPSKQCQPHASQPSGSSEDAGRWARVPSLAGEPGPNGAPPLHAEFNDGLLPLQQPGAGESPRAQRGVLLASGDGGDEGRWHDVMHRALMGSLQAPRAEHPTWWGKRFHSLQRRLAEVLESREAHYAVIGMVLLDLAIVLTELVLSSFYPTPETAPHLVHAAEEALSRTSVGILALFNSELLAKLLVFGLRYFTESSWHTFDALIVVISFSLELSLRGVAQEVASLLIFFRLWRILRIMHSVAEAMELNHSQELTGLQARVQGLETELSVSCQRVAELQQQVSLLHVAAAAQGLDLPLVLAAAAAQQQQLAAVAQQQLLAAAAATASKGLELHTVLAAAAAQQQAAAAAAQQQLLAAAASAVGPGLDEERVGGVASSAAAAEPLLALRSTAVSAPLAEQPNSRGRSGAGHGQPADTAE